MYERTGVVIAEAADDLLDTANQLGTDVLNWLKDNPTLN